MKKSWQKIIPIVVCIIALLIGLTSCNLFNKNNISNEKKLVGVRLEGSPIIIEVGDVDAIQLTAHLDYDDGTTESVLFTKDDIPEDILAFANEPGEYPIEMLYRDFEVSFTLIVKTPTPKFSVKFINYNNEVVKEEFVEQGKSATAPSAEEMFVEGVHFTGEFDKDFSSVTQDLEVRGIYKEMYTVEFFNGKSELISSQKVICGNDAIEPSDAEKAMEGYVWQFWDNDFTNIQKDTKVYGVYLKAYTIIYSSEDETRGTVSGNVASGSAIVIGTAISLSAEPNEGYTFSGWYIDDQQVSADCEYSFIALAKNYTLVARFAENEVKYSEGLEFVSYDDGTCYVAGIGTCTDTDIRIPPVSPEGDRVRSIGTRAFSDCMSITSVIIPTSVEMIGEYAFYYCHSLASINITDSVTSIGDAAFFGCYSLDNVIIPNSVITIGESAFVDCESLTNIIIPNSITTIGYEMFCGCISLKSIDIPENITSIEHFAFSDCASLEKVIIPNGVLRIEAFAFERCISLETVIIPESVTSIDYRVFCECTSIASFVVDENNISYVSIDNNLYTAGGATLVKYAIGKPNTSFEIPETVTNIGSYAFSECKNLSSVTIQNGVNKIGDCAFEKCINLDNISIPYGVREIGYKAFEGCKSLVNINIPESVTTFGNGTFSGCENLVNIILPYGVKSIGDGMFSDCINLRDVAIPNSVTYIGVNAFSRCISLVSISIPDSVTYIGDSAFLSCKSLISVIIPNSVTSIGKEVFRYCEGLGYVKIGENVENIGKYAFGECYSISYIEVDENNEYFKSIDGNLYDKNAQVLIQYSTGKTDTIYIIPDTVTSINISAFEYCTKLNTVVIPNSVVSIGDFAFRYCEGLSEVIIGSSVKYIAREAFNSCDNIENVFYAGSEEEWVKIEIIGPFNSNLLNATIHYNYTPEK